MKKVLTIDPRAEKELRDFPLKVQKAFKTLIHTLRISGRLQLSEGKKLGNNLFEIRVKVGNVYRGLYAYIGSDGIIILNFFQKKSQKTPTKNLRIARKRFKEYE